MNLLQKIITVFLIIMTTLSCTNSQLTSFKPASNLLQPSFNTFKRTPSQTTRILAGLKNNLTVIEINNLEKTYGIKFIKQIPNIKVAVFDSLNNNTSNIVNNMEKLQKFEYVEAEKQLIIDDIPAIVINDNPFNMSASRTDPLITKQWHLKTIRAQEAWQTTEGEGIIVAVVDSGVDINHPDLKTNIIAGYNVLEPKKPIIDEVNHGTHVAGIIASIKDNGIGGCGVAPKTKIMPVKVMDSCVGEVADMAEGIVWATDHKADIINLSLGSSPLDYNYKKSDKTLRKAIAYAFKHNVIVVAAIGNANMQENSTPAYLADKIGYTNLIVVGATTKNDEKSKFSNFGPWITVTAPGSNILSTLSTTESNKAYGTMNGTSMSAPIVSGIAALILSKTKNHDPYFVKSKIKQSVVDLGEPGFDIKFGYGRIDASLAVK